MLRPCPIPPSATILFACTHLESHLCLPLHAAPAGIEPLMAQIIHNRVEGALAKAAAIANN